MTHRAKSSPEEKLRLVLQYIAGEITMIKAAEIANVHPDTIGLWLRLYHQEGPLGLLNTESNRTYTSELKTEAVMAYLAREGSLRDLCIRFKIRTPTQLQHWIKLYNSGKKLNSMSGGSRMKKSRNTTLEERIQITQDCIASGYDYGGIALKYDVGYQQVYTWVKKFTKLGNAGLEDRRGQRKLDQVPRTPEEEAQIEIARLKHENYLLRMERDLLKKLEELERRDAFRK